VNGLVASPEENIELDRQIENDYLGLRIGILDQAAILLSRRGYLTRIDCATSQYERIAASPSMPRFRLLLVFSGVEKALVGTDYNRRVDECATAARSLLEAAGCVAEPAVLARVSAADYAAHKRALVGAPARRAAHFFSEVERVDQGIEAWKRGDLVEFGALMTASGSSSIHNYECGSPPLIDLYQILAETDGVFGARFSGAGFRGGCVALVDPNRGAGIAMEVLARYHALHPGLKGAATSVLCDPDDGARILDYGGIR
jgi:galactokinase